MSGPRSTRREENVAVDRSHWRLRRITNPAEQEAETHRYWHSRPTGERLEATWELSEAAYSIKRADIASPVKSLQEMEELASGVKMFEGWHPGDLLREYLGATPAEAFSLRYGFDPLELSGLLNGAGSITPEMAEKLGNALCTDPDFWIALQRQYDSAPI